MASRDYNYESASQQQIPLSTGTPGTLGNPPHDTYATPSDATSPTQQPTLASQPDSKGEAQEETPRWSELKTKAGKDRKRLPLACIACRRKKIRCSGEKPACKHCLKARIPCVYKVTTRKAAPRTDYMGMLDKRLKRMEERVMKIIPKDELPDLARAVVKPSSTQPPQKVRHSKKRSANDAFGSQLEKWAGKPDDQDSNHSSPPKAQTVEENNLLTEGASHLPTKEIQIHLAEVYFDFVYGQSYPLLHKPSFMRRLEAGTVPPVLLLAVCAISARFSTHYLLQTEPAFLRGERWARPALEIALKRFDCPNITILIVYLLLGTHEFATCQGGRSWMLGGMAHRMAYALQLHKDLDSDPQGKQGHLSMLSYTDREIRRRAMWSCFMMDRFNSSGTQRPMFASEEFMYLQLPIKESLFQQDVSGPTENLDGSVSKSTTADIGVLADPKSNMGVAAYNVKLVALWGRLVRYLNLGGREKDEFPAWSPKSTHKALRDELDQFHKSLPEDLTYTEENLLNHSAEGLANQFLYLHIGFQHCVLFIHRFAFPTTAIVTLSNDMPPQFLQEGRVKAVDAANNISNLIQEATKYRVTAPYAGYCVVTSSAVHIYSIFASKNPQLEATAKKHLAINISYLNKMKRYWGYFQFLTEHLKEIYRQYAEGTSTPESRTRYVWQYGDWYDRYPHGVSKTELEEPIVDPKREAGEDGVLSQTPEVQSVEQYIDALSPASKARQKALPGARGGVSTKKPRNKKKVEEPNVADSNIIDPLRDRAFEAMELGQSPFGPPESYDRSPMSAQLPDPLQSSLQVPLPDPASLEGATQQPGIMPQLDLQMVLASYNGINSAPSADMLNFWGADFATGGDMFSNESNSAWFMPFNMNPPMTEFGGNIDLGLGTPTGNDFWMTPPATDQTGGADFNLGGQG